MSDKARVARGFGEFFLLALLSLVAPLCVYIDLVVLGHEVSPDAELRLTELGQEILLLVSALCMAGAAWRRPRERGFLVLVVGLFGCMLIRELDVVLDAVWHGFWFWPALLVAAGTIAYAATLGRGTVLAPMADFFDTRAGSHILFGLVVVLVFSRVFGSGSLLWSHVMSSDYEQIFKEALQEGLELFGYVFIAYGSVRFARRSRTA